MDISKYDSGKIYKIVNNQNSDIYVGSTTMELEQRMIKHKCDAKQRPNLSKFYTYMNEIGINNFDIELLEEYPCETKEELLIREGELIKKFGNLNQRIEGRTEEDKKEYGRQWKQNNRDRINQQRNERRKENPEKTREEYKKHGALYRERHRDRLNEKASTKIDCECGGKYTLSHKAEHMNSKKHLTHLGAYNEEDYKQSKRCEQLEHKYEQQKDKLDEEKQKEYKKTWYENRKEELSNQARERITCECGMEICRGALKRHEKSQKHQQYLQQQEEN